MLFLPKQFYTHLNIVDQLVRLLEVSAQELIVCRLCHTLSCSEKDRYNPFQNMQPLQTQQNWLMENW